MNTKRNVSRAGLFVLGLLPLVSCTARYQDMLRDRDATITELESQLGAARNENSAMRRQNEQLSSELAALKVKEKEKVAEASTKQDPIERLKKDLDEEGVGEEAVKVRYRHGKISIGIANKVTFASGSKTISPEGQLLLKRLANVLRRQFPEKRIFIEGHTDTDPISKSKKFFRNNRHLSAERADAVASFLVDKCRIASRKVVIVGYGPNDPVSNSDKAQNRRVEIVVTD